jgi:hypothetical protein
LWVAGDRALPDLSVDLGALLRERKIEIDDLIFELDLGPAFKHLYEA